MRKLGYSEKIFLKKLGVRMHELRVNAGYTQLQIAVRTGISQNYISNFECGIRSPSVKHLIVIAKVLNCNVIDFFGGEAMNA